MQPAVTAAARRPSRLSLVAMRPRSMRSDQAGLVQRSVACLDFAAVSGSKGHSAISNHMMFEMVSLSMLSSQPRGLRLRGAEPQEGTLRKCAERSSSSSRAGYPRAWRWLNCASRIADLRFQKHQIRIGILAGHASLQTEPWMRRHSRSASARLSPSSKLLTPFSVEPEEPHEHFQGTS